MQELEITIDNGGRVLIGVKGVKGEDCIKLTRSLEESIGDVQDRYLAPEFFEKNAIETKITNVNNQ